MGIEKIDVFKDPAHFAINEDGKPVRPAFEWCGDLSCDTTGIQSIPGWDDWKTERIHPLLSDGLYPIHQKAAFWQLKASRRMDQYVTSDVVAEVGHRLYVMEYRGPGQYVKVGRAENYRKRKQRHTTEANRHGWALTDGWVSPRLNPDKLRIAERAALEEMQRRFPAAARDSGRERFYEVPFDEAVKVVWHLYCRHWTWWLWEEVVPAATAQRCRAPLLLLPRNEVAH